MDSSEVAARSKAFKASVDAGRITTEQVRRTVQSWADCGNCTVLQAIAMWHYAASLTSEGGAS